MILTKDKIKEDSIVFIDNNAEPVENCKKYFAVITYMDFSSVFYRNIYAVDRAQAFRETLHYVGVLENYNFISGITVNECES